MTTQEVANRLVELCRQGKGDQAQQELYAPNIVSNEPQGTPNAKVEGLEAVQAKGQQWYSMLEEFHGSEVSDPLVAGDHFTITMKNDVTFKQGGRIKIEEVCVYQVKDGKVVWEQFHYNVPG